MMLRAKPGCCEEAALGVPGGGYIPCNKPAANVIGWKGRPDAPILMCEACTDHNVRNRGGEVVTPLGCSCPKCKAECRRVPGWFTPEEAMRAIKAGMAKRLTVVHQADVAAVAPACSGMEGHESHYGKGRCTFLTNAGLCEIHDSGFKPVECVTCFACREDAPGAPDLPAMLAMWRTLEGFSACQAWRKAVRGAAITAVVDMSERARRR